MNIIVPIDPGGGIVVIGGPIVSPPWTPGAPPGIGLTNPEVLAPTTVEAESGVWVNPTNAFIDDGFYATAAPARNGSIAGRWGDFGFDVLPSGAIITNVTVYYEYKTTTTTSIATMRMRARVGGVAQANHDNALEPATDTLIAVNITGDRAWTRTDLVNANFKIVMEAIRGDSPQAVTFSLDYILVSVTWTTQQDLFPIGIPTGGAVGIPTNLRRYITPTGISSLEAFGSAVVNAVTSPVTQLVKPTGIATAQTFGTPMLTQYITASGIATAESVGTGGFLLSNGKILILNGPSSAEAVGTPGFLFYVQTTGIATAAAFGTPQVGPVSFDVDVTGIAGIVSQEDFGTPSLILGVEPPPPGAFTRGMLMTELRYRLGDTTP